MNAAHRLVAIVLLGSSQALAAPSADQLAASLGWREIPNGSIEVRVPADARRAGVVLISRDGGWSGAFRIGPFVIGSGPPVAAADVGRGMLLSLGGKSGSGSAYLKGDVALAGPILEPDLGPALPAGSREFIRDLGILGGRVGDQGNATAFLPGLEFPLNGLPTGAVGRVEPLGFRAGFQPTPLPTGPLARSFVDTSAPLVPRHRTFWDPLRRWYLFAIEDDGSGDSDFNDTIIALELGPANAPGQPRPKLELSTSTDARGGIALYGEPIELRVDVLGDSPTCATLWMELNTELNRPRAGAWTGWTQLLWVAERTPAGTRRTHRATARLGALPGDIFLGFGTHVWHANASAGLSAVPEQDWWIHPSEPGAWERSTRSFEVRARQPIRLWLASGAVTDTLASTQPWTAFASPDRGRFDLDASGGRRLAFHVGEPVPLQAHAAAADGNLARLSLRVVDPHGTLVGSTSSPVEPRVSGGLQEASATWSWVPGMTGVHTVEVRAATPWAHPYPDEVVVRWTLGPVNRAPSAALRISGPGVVAQPPGATAPLAILRGGALRLEARGEDPDGELDEVWIEVCEPGGVWNSVHRARSASGAAQVAVLPDFLANNAGMLRLRAAVRDRSGALSIGQESVVEVVDLVASVSRESAGRIYPGDSVRFVARAQANAGGFLGGTWSIAAPAGPGPSGALPGSAGALLTALFSVTASAVGDYTAGAEFIHASGLRVGASVPFSVEQGLYRHTVRARVAPLPGYEIWYEPSPEARAEIDVERPRD